VQLHVAHGESARILARSSERITEAASSRRKWLFIAILTGAVLVFAVLLLKTSYFEVEGGTVMPLTPGKFFLAVQAPLSRIVLAFRSVSSGRYDRCVALPEI
jgi:hypothetical protein